MSWKGSLTSLVAVICLCISFHAAADQNKGGGIKPLAAVCNKSITKLGGGMRFGALKSPRAKNAYLGPSVICHITEKVSKNSRFIVMGSAKSTFGKRWYFIHLFHSGNDLWIPAKHVTLGESYEPDALSEEIAPVKLSPTSSLNARACPHRYCKVVSALAKDKEYKATKKSEKGWYLIHLSANETGWANGKYLQKVAEPIVEKAVAPPVEKYKKPQLRLSDKKQPAPRPKPTFDPCRASVKTTFYKEKRVWHLQEDLMLKLAPHAQCGNSFELKKGSALVSLGETNEFYIVAATPNKTVVSGYLHKESFKEQYLPKHALPDDVDLFSIAGAKYLQERAAYWNSVGYLLLSYWQSVSQWYTRNTASANFFLIVSIVGLLLLFPRTRKPTLHAINTFVNNLIKALDELWAWLMLQRASIPVSNWNTMIQGLQYSPQTFFSQIETAIENKKIDHLKVTRILMREGGLFSARREYLRVTRKHLCFDICGAPFGNGFFVSWWLGEIPSGILAFLYRIPVLNWFAGLYERFVGTETYFTYDTRAMYQALTHDAVLGVVDHITDEKGMRALTQEERKPVMKDFFSPA